MIFDVIQIVWAMTEFGFYLVSIIEQFLSTVIDLLYVLERSIYMVLEWIIGREDLELIWGFYNNLGENAENLKMIRTW